MVFEYCEHDLGRLLDTMPRPFTEAEVKCLMKQAMYSPELNHLHRCELRVSKLDVP